MSEPLTIDELIERAGGLTKLARIAGVNHATIATSWKQAKRVPAERAIRVSEGLGLPLHQIRPDLWAPETGEAA